MDIELDQNRVIECLKAQRNQFADTVALLEGVLGVRDARIKELEANQKPPEEPKPTPPKED